MCKKGAVNGFTNRKKLSCKVYSIFVDNYYIFGNETIVQNRVYTFFQTNQRFELFINPIVNRDHEAYQEPESE